MMHVIRVEPLGEGWTVRSSQIDNDMPFRSGAAADTSARALAARLNAAGHDAEIKILLRDGAVAARFAYPATAGDAGTSAAGRRHESFPATIETTHAKAPQQSRGAVFAQALSGERARV